MKWFKVLLIIFIAIMIEQGFIDIFEKERKEKNKRQKAVIVIILLIIETMLIFSGGIV